MRVSTDKEVEEHADETRLAELREKTRFTRSDVADLMRLGRLGGSPPEPTGTRDGEPYWTREDFTRFAKSAPLVRNGFRSAVAEPRHHYVREQAPANARPSTLNESARSVQAVVTSTLPVYRVDWNTNTAFDEVLLMDDILGIGSGESVPLLRNHTRAIEEMVGSARNFTVEGAEFLVASLFFSRGEKAEAVWRDVIDGHSKSLSIAYDYGSSDIIRVAAGDSKTVNGRRYEAGDRPLWLVKRWRLLEVSVVAIPADYTAKIRSHHSSTQGSNPMSRIPSLAPAINRNAPTNLDECFRRDGLVVSSNRGQNLFAYSRLTPEQQVRTALFQGIEQVSLLALGSGFEGVPDSTLGWVTVVDAPNYKNVPVGRISSVRLRPQPRGATAEPVDLELTPGGVRISRYSRMTELSEEELANSASIQGKSFVRDAWLKAAGRGAAELKADAVYSLLLTNPEMTDGEDLFSAAHKNDFSCTLAELDATLSEVASAFAAQEDPGATKGEKGNGLGLRADVFITSSTLERPVRKLIREVDLYGDASTPAPIVRAEAKIENGATIPNTEVKVPGSPGTIFVASTQEGFGLTIAFLEGSGRRPDFSQGMFGNGKFGMWMSVKHSLGAALSDYRGLARIVVTEE